jgi:hypothetical protein
LDPGPAGGRRRVGPGRGTRYAFDFAGRFRVVFAFVDGASELSVAGPELDSLNTGSGAGGSTGIGMGSGAGAGGGGGGGADGGAAAGAGSGAGGGAWAVW